MATLLFAAGRTQRALLSLSMTQIACSALLFDLDGVLIDSTPAVARVWREWSLRHGFDPEEVVHKAHGRPSIATIREFLPNSDHEAENRIVERAEIEDVADVVPLPGSHELLSALPDGRWAIVTSCTRALAEARLRAAGLPIPKYLLTSTDVVKGKPDPEPYLKGAAMLGFPAADCLVLEDVPAGIRSGKAAGARVLAVRTTYGDADLTPAAPDWIVDGCASVWVESQAADGTLKLLLKNDVVDLAREPQAAARIGRRPVE